MSSTIWNAIPRQCPKVWKRCTVSSGAPLSIAPDSAAVVKSDAVFCWIRW